VWDGTEFAFTKTLTTPFDLSRCLSDGITKASAEIYGRSALPALLHSTKHIRYSTTRTNALVECTGPRIGLITDDIAVVGELRGSAAERALFDDLVGDRVAAIDVELSDVELTGELVRQVNRLTTDGAARLVVAAGDGVDDAERRIRRILLRRFPRGYIAIDATDERQPKLRYVSWRRHLIEHEDLLRRTSTLRVRHQSTPS
jgi:N-methylhydantoinase A